jgi:membrane fusion protein (multidrug efflux system)
MAAMRIGIARLSPELSRARFIDLERGCPKALPEEAARAGRKGDFPGGRAGEVALSQALEDPHDRINPAIDQRRESAGAPATRDNAARITDPRAAHSEGNGRPPGRSNENREKKQTSWLATLRRHPLVAIAIVVVALICATGGLIWWLNARQYESTDDAFIDARTVSISSQINGAIVEVSVTDNQAVDANATLARIDDRDYRSALDQANAQIDQAASGVINLDAQIEAQQARIEQAEKQVSEAQAALTFAQDEDTRAQDLLKRGAGTQQRAQQTSSDLRQKQAAMDGAQANLVAAQKQIDVLRTQRQISAAQLEQAKAAKEQADANLSRVVITAPTAGRVTKLTAAKGAYAQSGQSLMMFVPQEVWVTANFKETQLSDMHPGQGVDIRIDAYPGHPLRGHVDSIQSGSGAAFSLLPPENATGNYVKVVQRVPVKIVFDQPPDVYLGPGMSVVPDVKVR